MVANSLIVISPHRTN